MPKITRVMALQGTMPADVEMVTHVAKELHVTRMLILKLIEDGKLEGWLYLDHYMFCRKADVVQVLKGRNV